jgi:hypothetical protein
MFTNKSTNILPHVNKTLLHSWLQICLLPYTTMRLFLSSSISFSMFQNSSNLICYILLTKIAFGLILYGLLYILAFSFKMKRPVTSSFHTFHFMNKLHQRFLLSDMCHIRTFPTTITEKKWKIFLTLCKEFAFHPFLCSCYACCWFWTQNSRTSSWEKMLTSEIVSIFY